ncbi:hypothetical protein EGW08_015198 [Elysia chlorotica]|uniref:G-protein coupled receptors family 1 profile domain-containing protein n=1 Tax=Elysia chlorotica TaxID=188477 RepID=A0A433T674_ELYCH|nr:hypothetical protein EGW08_015198 [Elysia chlorotica]
MRVLTFLDHLMFLYFPSLVFLLFDLGLVACACRYKRCLCRPKAADDVYWRRRAKVLTMVLVNALLYQVLVLPKAVIMCHAWLQGQWTPTPRDAADAAMVNRLLQLIFYLFFVINPVVPFFISKKFRRNACMLISRRCSKNIRMGSVTKLVEHSRNDASPVARGIGKPLLVVLNIRDHVPRGVSGYKGEAGLIATMRIFFEQRREINMQAFRRNFLEMKKGTTGLMTKNRMIYLNRLGDIAPTFKRCQADISHVASSVLHLIYRRFQGKLDTFQHRWLECNQLAMAVHDKDHFDLVSLMRMFVEQMLDFPSTTYPAKRMLYACLRMVYPNRLGDIAPTFRRCQADISHIASSVLHLIYRRFHGKLDTLQHRWLDCNQLTMACTSDHFDLMSWVRMFVDQILDFPSATYPAKRMLYACLRGFNLDNCTDEQCLQMFRFRKSDLNRLCICRDLGDFVVTLNGLKVPAIEALCIFLRRMVYPNRLGDIAPTFRRNVQQLLKKINAIARLRCTTDKVRKKWKDLSAPAIKYKSVCENKA